MHAITHIAGKIPGIQTKNPIFYDDNPALHEEGQRLFLDGWYELIIICTGDNPFYRSKGAWRTCVIWWQNADTPFGLRSQDGTGFFELIPGDQVRGFALSEEGLPSPEHGNVDIFGIWLSVFFNRDNESFRSTSLLQPLSTS